MKKKTVSLILILCMLISMTSIVSVSAMTSGTCGIALKWTLIDGTLTISGTGNMKNWNSYSSVPWYSSKSSIKAIIINNGVTSISDYAFRDCYNLTSVAIGDSVTNIGNSAFYNCSSLANLTIGSSVETIGSSSFMFCRSLTSVALPNSITTLGNHAFSDCGLTNIIIPDNVTTMGDSVFSGCTDLTDVTISASVISIGNRAFSGCSLTNVDISPSNSMYSSENGAMFNKDKNILICYFGKSTEEYTIPSSVTSIECYAFSDCSLKSIIIPNSITYIGEKAFSQSDITSVTIPASVMCIDNYAFDGCGNLTSVTIENGVISIGECAFGGCGISNITIPDSVTSIGDMAFCKCDNLSNAVIGNGVKSIGNDIFYYCSSLTNIAVGSSNSNYSSENGVLFNKNRSTLICYPRGKSGAYIIPNSVTNIGDSAFCYCDYLTSITIPNSVTIISDSAFDGCKALKNISIGNNVKNIGTRAFNCCFELTSVTIPNSVTSIGDSAFSWCYSLTNLTIGNGITSIGNGLFSYCDALTHVAIGSGVTSISTSAFASLSSLTNINVNSSNSTYSSENGVLFNKNKSTLIRYPKGKNGKYTIPSSVTAIGTAAFSGCKKLTSVTIPNTVTIIGYDAFYYCNNLTDVYYTGNEDDWTKIDIDYYNECLTNATIHYNSNSNNTASIPISSVHMYDDEYTINVGKQKMLHAYYSPSNATNRNMKWSSSNTRIATVNDAGIVTGKSEGTVTITVKSSNGKSASCTVKVVIPKMNDDYRYSFFNSAKDFGYAHEVDEEGNIIKINYQIPKERYLQLGYGKAKAEQSLKNWGGNCFGMSMSSILFYKDILNEHNYHVQGLYEPIPSLPIELLFPDKNTRLREMIELLHISQHLKCANAKPFNTNEVIQELNNDNPVILGMYTKDRKKGHAIVIRGYSVKDNGSYELDFYDCGAYITGPIECDKKSKITLGEKSDDAPDWKIFEYYSYNDLFNIYCYIKKNGKNAISLLSIDDIETYTQIITPARDLTISDSQGRTLDIQDGEICNNIDNSRLTSSSYLAEEDTYTIILPTDTYTIVGDGDEEITTSFADDYMSASVTAKASTPITISSDLKEITVGTAADEAYNIKYTTYDNIFDEMTLSGISSGALSSTLNCAEVTLIGAEAVTAAATVSGAETAVNAENLSDYAYVTVLCENTSSTSTIQLLTGERELSEAEGLPEREQAEAPVSSLQSGSYTEGQLLTFTKDNDTVIYYTTDGSTPTADTGIIYSLPIEINKSMTVKAISTKYGYLDSNVVELSYTLPVLNVPEADISEGKYDKVITVELSTDDYEDTIYYTLDGSSPFENGILYTVPINISEDAYLQAYALRDGCVSEVTAYEYTVNPTYPFYISNSLTNQDGEIITQENIADVTKLRLMLTKLKSGEHTGTFLIAFYDSENKLIYVNSKPATISDNMQEVEIDITGKVSSACTIKAFAWKDLSIIEPICEAWVENIAE